MKRDIEYAYAVARVRANELTLLSAQEAEQLVTAPDYSTAMRRLSEAGWGDFNGSTDYTGYLENYFDRTWQLLSEIMDDIHELDLLLIKNDMQNLKAALKSIISQHEAEGLYVNSTVYDRDKLIASAKSKEFGELPEFMRKPAEKAYAVLTSTANGQLADAIIDGATLERILFLGRKSASPVLKELAERICATADIKTALRGARTGKDALFFDAALVECGGLSKSKLKEAALESTEAVLKYVSDTSYARAGELYKRSSSAFEKWCDDILMECVDKARYTAFGIDPLVAYYVARDTEIKTVRIILSAKINNIPANAIRERVRTLYV